jgi:hypothetical protein
VVRESAKGCRGSDEERNAMSGSTGISPIQSYLTDSTNETKYANANAAGNAQANSLINYFQKNASTITSPAALLGNYKALSVVLGAFGLSSSINDTALLQKLLTQDPTSKTSLAQTLGNAKYTSLANALSTWKPPPFATTSGINSVITAYKTNLFESSAGSQTAGLQNALYFTRIAGSIKTVTQLQSDANLLAVAVTGLGLPLTAYDNLTFTQQTALLTSKLKIADLQKPTYVKHLAELYLVQQQLNAPTTPAAPAAGTVASLFSSGTATSANGVLTILEGSNGGTTSLLGTTTTGNTNLLSLFA